MNTTGQGGAESDDLGPWRTGLFLSRADGAISSVIDVDEVGASYPHLTAVEVLDDFFSAANRRRLFTSIQKNRLDGVVLAAESPFYYENSLSGSLFLDELIELGINVNQIGYANLLEHVALPHKGRRKLATIKARALIDVALAKVHRSHPVEMVIIAPRQSVCIFGTTIGGIFAAQRFLEAGFRVDLMEEQEDVRSRSDSQSDFAFTLGYVESHPRATFHFGVRIADVYGWCGDYTVEYVEDGRARTLNAGGLVVALGDDRDWTARLQPLVQIDTDEEGRFRVKNPTTLPVQTRDPGKVVIPWTGETRIHEEVAYADSATLTLQIPLSKKEIGHALVMSELDEDVCGGCGTCVRTCAFRATTIDQAQRVSVIDPRRCRGCGNCVVACPVAARDLVNYTDQYITDAIRILGAGPPLGKIRILAMLCDGCGYPAADRAGRMAAEDKSLRYEPYVLPLGIECGGRIDTKYVLQALNVGFDGVIIARCRRGHCHNIIGNRDMDGRMSLFRTVMRAFGLDDERLRILDISPQEGERFAREIQRFSTDMERLRKQVKQVR